MNRRQLLIGAAAACVAPPALANVPTPYSFDTAPPKSTKDEFIAWMVKTRGENPSSLAQRYDRYLQLVSHKDIWDDKDIRAYLMTPREQFVTAANLGQAYEWHHLNIGFGVTITGPHTVARMTETLAIQNSDKVLEIGTGSGYQSAYLSNLTPHVFSIEIIPPLFQRTRAVYDRLIGEGYSEYSAIKTKNADGYYGWADNAPFDKIIVTCGIDHIPPPLLQQLKTGGIMVIPVGPPGAQHVLKVLKSANADGSITATRSDIYGGSIVPFVPFTGGHQG